MIKNIRDRIIQESEKLFRSQGYEKTSMRQIADACSISVGNLCYYFSKKEDLIMLHHNVLLDQFFSQLPDDLFDTDSLKGYFAAEYAFAADIFFTPEIRSLYSEVINIPALRQEYYARHHDFFMDNFPDSKSIDTERAFLSTVAMSSLEFNLIEVGPLLSGSYSFNDIMSEVFLTRIRFLGYDTSQYERMIQQAIQIGSKLSRLS